MASVQQLKSRIRSVNSTKQITGAMQLVAASKMRCAIANTTSTLPYTNHARELLHHLTLEGATEHHPYFVRRPIKRRLLLVISSDTGMAGAYNANIFKQYVAELRADEQRSVKSVTIALGRKISQFAARLKSADILGTFDHLPTEQVASLEISTILSTILGEYLNETIDAVDVIYTKFNSSLSQQVVVQNLLPAGQESSPIAGENDDVTSDFEFEPSRQRVLDEVVDRLVEAQITQALLDAIASEQSMRMLAMKNATDNATSLVDDLTLAMNKERQAAITQEISEISSGAEAVE
jgi:F-type H+-transporting ATPase subunit gamma